MDHVSGVGKGVQEPVEHGTRGGADQRTGQETHSPFLLADGVQLRSNGLVDLGPFGRLALLQGLLQPLLVVKSQKRGLPGRAQPAARQGMLRVAFQLDRPAIAVLDQQAAAGAATAARRGIIIRPARNDLLRCDEIGNGILHGGTLAAGQGRARKGKPGQLQEIAPARSRRASPAPHSLQCHATENRCPSSLVRLSQRTSS